MDMKSLATFWRTMEGKGKPSQLERYTAKGSTEHILRFIQLGGGPKMGVTCEEYARHHFTCLKKRRSGKETGYDHILEHTELPVAQEIEQKSSGHWGENDYKWQHVEAKHNWKFLLLCGIDYTELKFWCMDRRTFEHLITEKKITNQGNKTGDSSEGMWFNYLDVKDSLVEVPTDELLIAYVKSSLAS
jgi:hypothetical protein